MANEIKTAADAAYADETAPGSAETKWPDKPEIRALFGIVNTKVEDLQTVAQSGVISFATWAALAARATGDLVSGATGKVYSDAGTHTDPVVGGTVDNEGVYSYSLSPAGWERVANLEAEDAAGFAAAAAASAAALTPFATPTPAAALAPILDLRLFKYDPAKFYSVRRFWHKDVGTRFALTIQAADDESGTGAADVAEINIGSGVAYTGITELDLEAVGSTGELISVVVDFGDGTPVWALYSGDWSTAGISARAYASVPAWNHAVDDRADARIEAFKAIAEPWKLCADPYAQALFGDAAIAGLDPDDRPFTNYETAYYAGIPLYRIQVYLHSTKIGPGAVARWSQQSATVILPGDLPSEIQLSMRADGADASKDGLGDPVQDTNGDDLQEVGVSAFFQPDWTKLEWTHGETTYTTADECAVSPRVIVTADELERRWLARTIEPRRKITIGGTNGDFATLVAAIQAYENPAAAGTITRSTFPVSNLLGPEWPAIFEVIDPHAEAVGNFTHLGIPQSELRVPHGALIRLRYDTHLYKAASANSAPLAEWNYTGVIEANGALLENQDDAGYILHWDAGGLAVRLASDGQLRRRFQTVLSGARLKMAATNADPLIGAGIGDGQHMLIEQTDFQRLGSVTTAMMVCHGSPNSVDPGNLTFRSCTSNDGDIVGSKGIVEVLKSTAGTHRHILTVDDCDTSAVTWGNTFGDGLPGWVARGRMSGLVIPTELQP